MLTQLKLKNFKIWKSTGQLALAPVTLFLGANSSGKSSLIQALLLIRQTVNAGDDSIDLNLGHQDRGDTVELGQFKDLLCRHGSSSEVGIEFRWAPDGDIQSGAMFSAEYKGGKNGEAILDSLRIGPDQNSWWVTHLKERVYRFWLGSERRSRKQGVEFRPVRSFGFTPMALTSFGDAALRIQANSSLLVDELRKITYLAPLRQAAKRNYGWNGQTPTTIADDGARAVDALIASGVAFNLAKQRKLPTTPLAAELILGVSNWLNEMDLADSVSVKQVGKSYLYEILVHKDGKASNLRDVGVGVSQVLPVIIAALHARPGHIVILEEPESHLHPLAQAVLAELLTKVSKERNVQFVIETHSEHMFRRLQTLLAKSEVLPEECALYFIEKEGGQANIRRLSVDSYGKVKDWPDRFFGDTLGETRTQTEYAIRRAKEERLAGNGVLPG
ncbi:MAG: DUF3696 domain-containing protein [Fibrobacteria bacterium]|nr:DUF3696 domain-containing protein [Fibrobacteria bacterium]